VKPAPDEDVPVGLYVHIPFCEVKCSYCHFAIDPRRPGADRQERYLQAVLREMEVAAPARADTLYFGGGTPSLFAPQRIGLLVQAARGRFGLPMDAEVTLECNPRDLELDAFEALREAGIGRLSLGVQHFDDDVLADMGRRHAAADAVRAVELAQRAGFVNVSIDLMLGWPSETPARWAATLERALDLGPEHLSLYVLELEPKTALAHRAQRGTLSLPEDDLVADLYQGSVERLAEAGLRRYEISNFARPGFESRHNGKYWDDLPFLGFGLSAHSYREDRRSWNRDSYAPYCVGIETEGSALAGERRLTPRERVQEALFTGLRRSEGIDLRAFELQYGVSPLQGFEASLRDPLAAGLLEQCAGRLRLSDRGVLLSSEVFRGFV